jgi:hypothetical protein
VFERLKKFGDPWHDFRRRSMSLSPARVKLEELDVARRLPQEAELR